MPFVVRLLPFSTAMILQLQQTASIFPATIVKAVPEGETRLDEVKNMSKHDLGQMEITLEAQMAGYAHDLDFERAIECRDRIKSIQREIKYKNEK